MLRLTIIVLASLLTFAAPSTGAETLKIVALGDSLTAGYGLAPADAFPVKLEQALRARGHDIVIANAGVSGDTATGGLSRLDWAVPDGTDAVILELGANDALRGIDPLDTHAALDVIVSRLKARKIAVLLAGMRAPPNMGAGYVKAFNGIFPELADKHGTVLYPFFLEGVAGNRSLNLPDGIHPTAQGIDKIVASILPAAEKLIAAAKKR